MNCEKCGAQTYCIDTRLNGKYRKRRYKCPFCEHRFNTMEIIVRSRKQAVEVSNFLLTYGDGDGI